MKKQLIRLLMIPVLLLTFLAVSAFATAPTTHAQSARSADSSCATAHVESVKRNGPDDNYTIARYIMNKHFCYDGTNVTSSDQADVRGYIVSELSLVYEFKGNISTQNGSPVNGSSTAQGSFAVKLNATLPGGFGANDLGLWQPSISIQPHGDGGFDYAPSSGSGEYDVVLASYV